MAGLQPHTLLTTASPHLGVGRYGYLGLIPRWLQKTVGSRINKSVRELLLADRELSADSRPPLLVRMACPDAGRGEPPFLPALAAFQRRVLYANVQNDFLVAYETAALAAPRRGGGGAAVLLPSLQRLQLGALPRVLHDLPRESEAHTGAAPGGWVSWQPRMAAGLATRSWREVAVAFPGMLPLAHNKIVALRRDPVMTFLNREGEPIVRHQAAVLLEEELPQGGSSSGAELAAGQAAGGSSAAATLTSRL